jgi:hypothetical protein
MIDVIARHLEGMSIAPEGGGLPQQLLLKSNSSSWTVGGSLDVPPNYEQQFKALWHI